MKKRLILFFLLMTLFSVKMRADETKEFYLYLGDGTRITLAFADSPRLYFQDDIVRIVTPHLDVEYAMSEFGRITADASNDIESEIVEPEYKVEIMASEIVFTGFPPASMVIVRTLQGQEIVRHLTSESGDLTISIEEYPMGIYLFTTDTFTYKLMKK